MFSWLEFDLTRNALADMSEPTMSDIFAKSETVDKSYNFESLQKRQIKPQQVADTLL